MHHRKNPELRGMKKKEFPPKYEFLADIVGKCILCKDSAHDAVSDTQLRLMTAIVKRYQLNFGALLLTWISKWILDEKKSSKKMYFGRFISILLKKLLKDQIKDSEGEALNVNKRITQKLFTNWSRIPGEQQSSRQTGGSADTPSRSQRIAEKEDSITPQTTSLTRKRKIRSEVVREVQQDPENSQGSSALPYQEVNVSSSGQPPKQKKKKAGKVIEPEPIGEEEVAVKVDKPEPVKETPQSTEGETQMEVTEKVLEEHQTATAEADSEVEIIAVGRNELQRSNFNSLHSFLPYMPFHRALCHNNWDQLFWTYKFYPNVVILAHSYPYKLHFAQKLILNTDSIGSYNKLTFIPILSFITRFSFHTFFSSSSFEEEILSDSSESSDDIIETSNPIQDLPSNVHTTEPSTSLPQTTQNPIQQLTLRDIPSTSQHEYFHIPPSMPDSNPSETNTLLKTILDQVAQRPTTSTLAELAMVLETGLDSAIESSSQSIQHRLEDIIEGANQLPQFLSSRLKTRVDEIIQTMGNTNQLILSEISKHKKTVELLHTSQQQMSSAFIQEIFDMKMLLRQQNERFDTAMAKIQDQQQQSESFLIQQRNDISANQSQMQELLTSVQHLADTINDDNKGEMSQGRGRGTNRGRLAEERGRGRGVSSSATVRGRGERGESSSGHRGRSSYETSRSSSRPPLLRTPQVQASSSRPVAANVEEEIQWFNEEIRVKEELMREEEEEENRRNQQRRDSSSSSRRR